MIKIELTHREQHDGARGRERGPNFIELCVDYKYSNMRKNRTDLNGEKRVCWRRRETKREQEWKERTEKKIKVYCDCGICIFMTSALGENAKCTVLCRQ